VEQRDKNACRAMIPEEYFDAIAKLLLWEEYATSALGI
jgi:hypothetical protein